MKPGLCAQADAGRAGEGFLRRIRHAVERYAPNNRDDDGRRTGHDECFHEQGPPKPIGFDYSRYGFTPKSGHRPPNC